MPMRGRRKAINSAGSRSLPAYRDDRHHLILAISLLTTTAAARARRNGRDFRIQLKREMFSPRRRSRILQANRLVKLPSASLEAVAGMRTQRLASTSGRTESTHRIAGS